MLERTIEKGLFGLLALFDALFERSGHNVKGVGKFPEFSFFAGQSRAARQVTRAQAPSGCGENPNLAENKPFTAEEFEKVLKRVSQRIEIDKPK